MSQDRGIHTENQSNQSSPQGPARSRGFAGQVNVDAPCNAFPPLVSLVLRVNSIEGFRMRRGFTLLEVLLAIGLTGVVGIAAIALQTMQARVGSATRAQEEALAEITETLRLLDDDLVLALPGETRSRFQVEEGALRLLTSCRLPGEERGVHEVRWSFDAASGALLRSSSPRGGGPATVRQVGRLWQTCSFSIAGERLWLEGRLGASGQDWRLPLWTESP